MKRTMDATLFLDNEDKAVGLEWVEPLTIVYSRECPEYKDCWRDRIPKEKAEE